MIARAKTSRSKVAKKKVAKTAAAAKPAKAVARSTRRAAKPAPTKKVASRRVTKTVAPVKAAAKRLAPKRPAAKKAAAKKPARKTISGKAVAAKQVVQAAKPVIQQVVQVVSQALDDMKAVDVTVLDVRNRTDIADTLIVASGTSDRHVRSIAQRVVENAKKAGFRPMGVEGEREGEWILVDLHDLIIHIMLPRVREFYRLENLWDVSVAHRETAATAS